MTWDQDWIRPARRFDPSKETLLPGRGVDREDRAAMSNDSIALRSAAEWGALRRLDPSMALWLLMIAVLVFLVASPTAQLFVSSFQEPETGRFTLANYRVAYFNLRHLAALGNSLELGVGVALMAGLFGVPIAWAISRTDMPLKSFVRLMILGAFITPPYLGAIGWILLAGPNSGWLNKLWIMLSGETHGIFNVYSMPGLILVVSVTSFPYVFVFKIGRANV